MRPDASGCPADDEAACTRTTPALIFCDPETAATEVAGLTVLDRLLVAVHRAGCDPLTIVCRGTLPRLTRSLTLGIVPQVVHDAPPIAEPTLMAAASLIVEAQDVRRAVQQGGQLTTAEGDRLPLGLTAHCDGDLKQVLDRLPAVRAEGVAQAAADPVSAAQAESRLWQSLASATDGLVDRYVNRPLGRPLSKLLIRTPITPNHVTAVATLIGLVGAWCFSRGTYASGIVGALLFQGSALLDCVDGELARVLFKESRFGKWLDLWLDQAVHLAIFAAIPVGLWTRGSGSAVLWLGISGVAGALLSFAVVLHRLQCAKPGRNEPLDRLILATANRDFSILLIGLAVIGRLEWFVWLMGILVHVFWLTALWLSLPARSSPRTGST